MRHTNTKRPIDGRKYTVLLNRLYQAVIRLHSSDPTKCVLLGLHFERWDKSQNWDYSAIRAELEGVDVAEKVSVQS